MSGFVSAGEMAHEQGEIEPRHDLAVAGKCGEIRHREAEPVDAGVDMQSARQRSAVDVPKAIHSRPRCGR